MKITKKLQREFLKNKLSKDPHWAQAALLKIFQYQTSTEQAMQSTVENNGVGFSGVHAEILSSFARQLQYRNSLSPKQMAIVFKIIPKYHKQIMAITNQDKLLKAMIKDQAITEADVVAYMLCK